jgi:hypothetical protein
MIFIKRLKTKKEQDLLADMLYNSKSNMQQAFTAYNIYCACCRHEKIRFTGCYPSSVAFKVLSV